MVVPLDPLVHYPLVPVYDWAPKVLHPLIGVPCGVDGVPEESRALPGWDGEAQQGEDGVTARLHRGEEDHEGEESLPCQQPVGGPPTVVQAGVVSSRVAVQVTCYVPACSTSVFTPWKVNLVGSDDLSY